MPHYKLLHNVLPKMAPDMKRVFVTVNNENIMFELPSQLDQTLFSPKPLESLVRSKSQNQSPKVIEEAKQESFQRSNKN